MIIAPRSRALSSPILPFERFTMRIFRSSMIFRMLMAERGWPRMFRIKGFETNCPTLFWIAATASVSKRWV